MGNVDWGALCKRSDWTEGELYNLLETVGSSTAYSNWLLTAPICMDFELCRTETADFSLCCALLTGILRESHFDNFRFEERVTSGVVNAILDRMAATSGEKALECPPMFSLEELWTEKCAQVPWETGVYYVLLPEGEPLFCEDHRGGYKPELLAKRWERSGGKCLYIGKASGKGGLRRRLYQYMRSGYAGGKNHRGGRAIWQVKQRSKLRVSWQVCPGADMLEKKMLKQYQEIFKCYPMANWRG